MAKEWREVLARRNRTSKTKRLYEDDQPTNSFSWDGIVGTSLHYEETEGSGDWLEVDPRIVPTDEPGWDWEMQKSHWRFLVRNGGWFAAEKQGVGIGFRLERIAYLNIATKEFETIRTASYTTPTVETIEHGNNLLANPLGKLTWANLFPGVDFEVHVSGDRLHEEIKVSQAARNAMPSPPYPAADTYLVLVYEVDWGQVPGLADDDGDIDYDTDFERQARLYLKNHEGEIVTALPASRAWAEDDTEVQVPLRKRFVKVGGQHYLLVGAPVLALNALPEGTIIFDPDIDEIVGADADDCYSYGGAERTDRAYLYHCWGDGSTLVTAQRFTGITIDPETEITNAQFSLYGASGSYTLLDCVFYAEDADNGSVPESSDIDGLPKTDASYAWEATLSTSAYIISPANSFDGIIQEVVNRLGFGSASITIIGVDAQAAGFGQSVDWSGDSAKAAKLHIEYTAGGERIPRHPAAYAGLMVY
ncbi:MAG TPA: hypothetical protein VMX14_03715 [Anaerolineae bacterium]|nr:hypothetical protein [Anaerolineae bacterium]HUW13381.1 hypothetical protein [Anaerolineae bacterium]